MKHTIMRHKKLLNLSSVNTGNRPSVITRFLLFALFLWAVPSPTFAQIDMVERGITQMMKKAEFSLISAQYSTVKEQESMFKDFQLDAGKEYIIVAYGEKGVLDTDIQILNKANEVQAKDKDSETLSTVKFAPVQTEYYKVLISNYNSEVRNHPYIIKYLVYEHKIEVEDQAKEIPIGDE
jgi:hypothetical protein